MKEKFRHKSTDLIAGYIREAKLFQQHASVGMYAMAAIAAGVARHRVIGSKPLCG